MPGLVDPRYSASERKFTFSHFLSQTDLRDESPGRRPLLYIAQILIGAWLLLLAAHYLLDEGVALSGHVKCPVGALLAAPLRLRPVLTRPWNEFLVPRIDVCVLHVLRLPE